MKSKSNAFIANYNKHKMTLETITHGPSLRKVIAEKLSFYEWLFFGINTSQCFQNLLIALERKDAFFYVYSDVEHPCFQGIIEKLIPASRRLKLNLVEHLINAEYSQIEKILKKVVYSELSVVRIISETIWCSGAVLDTKSISAEIKRNSDDLIVVDGAQSFGNINPQISFNIDFYLTCTHKWIGTDNTLGILLSRKKFREVGNFLSMKDLFSTYAGAEYFPSDAFPESTYNMNYLLSVYDEISSLKLKEANDLNNKFLKIFGDFDKSFVHGRFKGVIMDKESSEMKIQEFDLSPVSIVADKNLTPDTVWLRVGF